MHTSSLVTRCHTLPNGLTIVGEMMPAKRAAAWTFLVPAGSATEPAGREGLTGVLEGLSYPGAGDRDSRQLSDALDDLGVDRGGGADTEYTTFSGATLGDYLAEVWPLYADIIRRPTLPANEWEAQRDLALQAIDSLEDNPAAKMFVQLRHTYFPGPAGRSPMGTREGLRALTLDDLRTDHAARFLPSGAILGLAGNIDFDRVTAAVEELFGEWQGTAPTAPAPQAVDLPVYEHIQQETAQHHIGVAYDGVPAGDADVYSYRVAVAVLSGGMGARLFTQVREKRGLAYSVSASAVSARQVGVTLAYAGTTPERSQETLDVLLGELRAIAQGVTEAEVERAKTGMLSSLVMQEESSRSRAAAIARDQYVLGRVRSLDEISTAVAAVTPGTIAAYYEKHPPEQFAVVTLGPRALEV